MTKHSSSPTPAYGQTETLAPLSAIELSVLNQLLAGYSDILVASALRSIQTKIDSKNLVQATIKLVQSGALKI